MRRKRQFEIAGVYPLTTDQVNRLANFNSEVARGLIHTTTYQKMMADLQEQFDKAATFGQPRNV